jgi:hypothetical protein
MKRILTYAFLCSIIVAQISCDKKQEESTSMDSVHVKALKTTKMEFIEPEFEFGNVNEGDTAKHEFIFKNTGTEPLYVRDAKASCGCTIPQWTKDTIPPGADGKILVQFNSKGRPGDFTKSVTVMANTDPEASVITIKGHVIEALSGPFAKESK